MTRHCCKPSIPYTTKILSSKGDAYYDVAHLSTGWTCACPVIQMRRMTSCKHIVQAIEELCNWQGDESELDDGCCPLCGNETQPIAAF